MVLETETVNRKRPFKCDVCDFSLANKEHLKVHKQLVHHEKGNFKCELCNRIFSRKQYLQKHVTSKHEVTTELRCNICDKEFISAYGFQVHKQSMHNTKENTIECTFCKKLFASDACVKHT